MGGGIKRGALFADQSVISLCPHATQQDSLGQETAALSVSNLAKDFDE